MSDITISQKAAVTDFKLPCVGIVIPAFNEAPTIEHVIQSVLAQPEVKEVVIIDDGSTDETPTILSELAHQDSRILVVTKANDGIVEARSQALRLCDAEFVACLDADDTAFPDRFARQLDYMAQHPECVAMGGAHCKHAIPR